jgi:hypothetical protein
LNSRMPSAFTDIGKAMEMITEEKMFNDLK